jgi:membrane-associated phospholipid phosphatase
MDTSAFRWINRLANRTGWAHWFFTTYAKYGIVFFAMLLVVAYLIGRQHNDLHTVAASVWAAVAALLALGIGQLIGGAIDRARPYETLTGVHVLVDRTTDFSFPSDHATVVGAVAVGLLFANRRWGTIAAVLALIMAFTRVYVGAHYPSDVLAGLALGGAVAIGGRFVVMPGITRLAELLSRTRLVELVAASLPDGDIGPGMHSASLPPRKNRRSEVTPSRSQR